MNYIKRRLLIVTGAYIFNQILDYLGGENITRDWGHKGNAAGYLASRTAISPGFWRAYAIIFAAQLLRLRRLRNILLGIDDLERFYTPVSKLFAHDSG